MFQGDVYRDVPFTKAGGGNNPPESEPPLSAGRRRHVATLLHPCDIVSEDNVTPLNQQPVAMVYDAAASGLSISDGWERVPGAMCPLPDLNGDGRMWVVDFRKITVINRSYLPADRRVRSLSEFGWALFRQSYMRAATRAELSIDDLEVIGKTTWIESEMETHWTTARGEAERSAFHEWLNGFEPESGYASRRRALEAGEVDLVWELLYEELGTE